MKNRTANAAAERGIAGTAEPASGEVAATQETTLRRALEAVAHERDLLRNALEMRQAGRDDALAAVTRAQDLQAQLARLKDELALACMRAEESAARCAELEHKLEQHAAERDQALCMRDSARAELATARALFEQRIAELSQAIEMLQRAPHAADGRAEER